MGMQELMAAMRGQASALEPVVLQPAGTRRVKFSGERGGDGPLTVGQANTLRWAVNPAEYTRMIQWVLDLPEGVTLADIDAAFEVLMARHESLRTTYPHSDPPVQRVAQSGELTIVVYEATVPASPASLANALVERLRSSEFDLTTDLLFRVAVAVEHGIPKAGAVVYSHMAADLVSMTVIGMQFAQLAADPTSREAGPLGHQPLDQAAAERSPRGQRQRETALRTWESQLRNVPQCLYAVPRTAPRAAPEEGDVSLSGWLWSAAAGLALPHIADRTGTSKQAAVLAALFALLGQRTTQHSCSLTTLMHNRYDRRLRGYVGSLACDTIISLDMRVTGFDELARRAGMMALKTGRGGLVDDVSLAKVISQVEYDRGIAYVRDCVFNDASAADSSPTSTPGDPAEAADAVGRSELVWVDHVGAAELLMLYLGKVEGELMLGAMTADPGRVPRADLESLLWGVERLLVAAATSNVPMDRLTEVTGFQPVNRGPNWVLADSCWVDLEDVQRLLDEALPGQSAHVFTDVGPAGEMALVAYLGAGNGARTPEEAHAACMAVLPRSPAPPHTMRPTTMTPSRYVVCAEAPSDPADLTAWQHQPVLATGPGRSTSNS
ncbi:MAG TPA: condensation domain-containing protein [Streptosporangiaceae bacterium]|nr:condensation domain-containing protein [Streptosporangiaceae bacterium]